MAYLKREDILNAHDLPYEDVDVPEWGGTVRVRALTAAERDAFEQSITKLKNGQPEPNMENIRAKLVALTLVDENGERLFSLKDVELLGKKSATALDKVFQVAQRLSGIGQQAFEEAEKN